MVDTKFRTGCRWLLGRKISAKHISSCHISVHHDTSIWAPSSWDFLIKETIVRHCRLWLTVPMSWEVVMEQNIIMIRRGCLSFIFISVKDWYINISTALIFGWMIYRGVYVFLTILFGLPSLWYVFIIQNILAIYTATYVVGRDSILFPMRILGLVLVYMDVI